MAVFKQSDWERHKALMAKDPDLRAQAQEAIEEMTVSMPNADKVVLKEIPARVEGHVVGKAVIYEDGTYDVILDDVIPEELKERMLGTVIAEQQGIGDN